MQNKNTEVLQKKSWRCQLHSTFCFLCNTNPDYSEKRKKVYIYIWVSVLKFFFMYQVNINCSTILYETICLTLIWTDLKRNVYPCGRESYMTPGNQKRSRDGSLWEPPSPTALLLLAWETYEDMAPSWPKYTKIPPQTGESSCSLIETSPITAFFMSKPLTRSNSQTFFEE
jgi:hypothetical protein